MRRCFHSLARACCPQGRSTFKTIHIKYVARSRHHNTSSRAAERYARRLASFSEFSKSVGQCARIIYDTSRPDHRAGFFRSNGSFLKFKGWPLSFVSVKFKKETRSILLITLIFSNRIFALSQFVGTKRFICCPVANKGKLLPVSDPMEASSYCIATTGVGKARLLHRRIRIGPRAGCFEGTLSF